MFLSRYPIISLWIGWIGWIGCVGSLGISTVSTVSTVSEECIRILNLINFKTVLSQVSACHIFVTTHFQKWKNVLQEDVFFFWIVRCTLPQHMPVFSLTYEEVEWLVEYLHDLFNHSEIHSNVLHVLEALLVCSASLPFLSYWPQNRLQGLSTVICIFQLLHQHTTTLKKGSNY